MTKYTQFQVGNKVRVKESEHGLMAVLLPGSKDKEFTISAVVPLSEPNKWYVDPHYWNDPKWS